MSGNQRGGSGGGQRSNRSNNRPNQSRRNRSGQNRSGQNRSQGGGGGGQKGRNRGRRRRRGGGKGQAGEKQKPMPQIIENHEKKTYGILFFDTLVEAKSRLDEIKAKATEVDQLNLVVKAEADMSDPELNEFGTLFAGEAWHLIHQRRVEDGWYEEAR